MKTTYRWNEEDITLDATASADGITIALPDNTTASAQLTNRADGTLEIRETVAHEATDLPTYRVVRIPIVRDRDGIEVATCGLRWQFREPSTARASHKAATGSGALAAPMSGVVADVMVQEGDIVAKGQPLLIIEAMKVMTTIEAPFAGTVGSVAATKGGRVEHGAVVVTITKVATE